MTLSKISFLREKYYEVIRKYLSFISRCHQTRMPEKATWIHIHLFICKYGAAYFSAALPVTYNILKILLLLLIVHPVS